MYRVSCRASTVPLTTTIISISIPFQATPRSSSDIPPPLPAKPKQSVYAQIGDTSGTYVQPQSILPPNYRQQPPPSNPNHSPIKTYGNVDTAGSVRLQYSNSRANPLIASAFEHQKHPSYLSKLVRLTVTLTLYELNIILMDSIFRSKMPRLWPIRHKWTFQWIRTILRISMDRITYVWHVQHHNQHRSWLHWIPSQWIQQTIIGHRQQIAQHRPICQRQCN